MQTTLLGLAFAVILALVAALLAPFFVDWTQFRPMFEAEATRMLGVPVRVSGAIDARILPSPSLTLHDLTIGKPNDAHALHARRLDVEFALGPLLRGLFRADEAHLVGPEFTVGVDEVGALVAPGPSTATDPNRLSIERLSIEDGRAHLVNAASGTRITLDKLWFNGDLRSLAGPFKGEGAFVTSGELYGYRISTGRLGDDGGLRVHVSLDPSDQLLTAEADGTMLMAQGRPHFQGRLVLSRPAGLVTATGRSTVEPPWHLTGQVDADSDDIKLDRIDYLYGSQDKGLHLTGTADLRLGSHPLFNAVLSAQQVDLDRLIATPNNPTRLPAEGVQALIAKFVGGWVPPFPMELSLSADTVTLGGGSVMLFGADMRLDGKGWTLDRVEFRAPGLTQVNLTGRLALQPQLAFSGPVRIETNDANALAAWVDGRKGPGKRLPVKVRGDAVLSETEFSLNHFQAEIDHRAVQGDLHYSAARNGHPSRLDAKLTAPELDVDSMMAFFEAVRAGKATPMPDELALGLDIGRAKIAGIEAQTVEAEVKRNAKLLQIERLSVADLGGAKLLASGRVDTTGAAPRGTLAFDVEAHGLDGLIALADEFAPQAAAPLHRAAALNPAATLHASVALDGPARPEKGVKTDARFSVEGTIAGLRASLQGEAHQDSAKTAADGLLAAFTAGDVRLDGQLDGDDGAALVSLLGLDKLVAAARQPGFVNMMATGNLHRTMQVQGRIVAGSLDGKAAGTVDMAGDDGPVATLKLDIAKADVRPLGGAGGTKPLPLSLQGQLVLNEREARLNDASATLAGSSLRGALTLGFGSPLHVSGHVDANAVDAAAVIASAIGAPLSASANKATEWSAEPYGFGRFGEFDGRVDVKAERATLSPTLVARQVTASVMFKGSDIALDKVAAKLGGGSLNGQLSFRRSDKGLAAHAKLTATGLDASALLPHNARPVIGGRLAATIDVEGSGLSPRALIGSLIGSGNLTLDDGYFANLDPDVFATAIRASDKGFAVDNTRVHDIVVTALDRGRLQVPHLETAVTVNGGQVHAANASMEAGEIKLSATGSLDLMQQQLDLRLMLSGPLGDNDRSGGRPDIFIALKGPWARPQRTVDVSALAGWLTIRRIDHESKRLEALEAARDKAAKATASRSDQYPPQTTAAPAGDPRQPSRSAPPKTRADRSQTSKNKQPMQLAPALPKPIEIPRPPTSSVYQRGSALDVPSAVPLWLPGAESSLMDSLVSTPHHR